MKIKKSVLQEIIQNYLFEDASTSFKAMNYIPKKAFSPIIVGKRLSNELPRVEGTYLGMKEADYGDIKLMYVLIDEDEKHQIPNLLKITHVTAKVYKKVTDVEEVMEAARESGFSLKKESVQKYVNQGRVLRIASTAPESYVYEPMSKDETAGRDFLKTTAIETTAAVGEVAAGIATGLGALPVAAAFKAVSDIANVSDLFIKIDEQDFLGCVFAIIGLIPGGDAASILKKFGAIDDMPSSLKRNLGDAIINIVDGDGRKTVEELVKSYKEHRPANQENSGMIVNKIIGAFQELGNFFLENPELIKNMEA